MWFIFRKFVYRCISSKEDANSVYSLPVKKQVDVLNMVSRNV